MAALFGAYPFLLRLHADGGYAGPRFQAGLARVMRQASIGIVKRSDTAKGFVALPKRWVVERSFGWLARFRRLSRDYERLPEVLSGLHFLVFAVLMLPNAAQVLASFGSS